MLGKRWPWRSPRSADASRLGHSTACRAARRLTFESLESRIVLSGVPFRGDAARHGRVFTR